MFELDANLLLSLYWLAISAGVLLPGIWLLIGGKTKFQLLNRLLQRFYLFGKLKNNGQVDRNLFGDVPKRYFTHFYIFGLLVNLPLLVYYRSAIFLHVLFLVHMCRRLYECLYVHRFSTNATMSLFHYLIGILHYPLVGLTIITDEKYGLASPSVFSSCLALILFVNASYIQHAVHVTLAKNRRTEKGEYPIPNGYWPFDYLSCPNYIAEIAIYVAFWFISQRSLCALFLIIWVLANQSMSCLLAHRWYRQQYGSLYPSNRRALIPFLL